MSPAFWLVTIMVGVGLELAWYFIEDPVVFQITAIWAVLGVAIIGTIDIWGRRD